MPYLGRENGSHLYTLKPKFIDDLLNNALKLHMNLYYTQQTASTESWLFDLFKKYFWDKNK